MNNKYSVNLFWSEEDEEFVATCSEFLSLSAFGSTRDEAVAEFEIVLRGVIEVYKEKGWDLPEPKELTYYSGQLRVRFPKSVHGGLVQEAEREGVSLNTLIVTFVSERLGAMHVLNNVEKVAAGLTLKADTLLAGLDSAMTSIERTTEQVQQAVRGIGDKVSSESVLQTYQLLDIMQKGNQQLQQVSFFPPSGGPKPQGNNALFDTDFTLAEFHRNARYVEPKSKITDNYVANLIRGKVND